MIDQVEEYINDNYENLIEKILTIDENGNIDISKIQSEEENLISCHITEYISDDRLTILPINVLYRLLNKITKKIQSQPKLKKEIEKKSQIEDNLIVDFLIKTIKRQGNEATILFKAVELKKQGIEYLIDQLRKEIESDEDIDIDFNFIKKEIIMYLSYKKEDDINKAKIDEENQKRMKDDFHEQIEDVETQVTDLRI